MIILIRGLPGSGKSTLARKMLNFHEKTIHLEADMYFTNNRGEYNWNAEYVHEAHRWCQDTARICLNMGYNVIVSNTFTTLKEMQVYLEHAEMIDTPIIVHRMTGNYGSIHNVPEATILKMRDRFEDYPGELLIA